MGYKTYINTNRKLTFLLLLIQLQSFQVEDINQDYDTGKGETTMVTFKVSYDKVEGLEDAVKSNCSRDIVFYKQWKIHTQGR